MPKQGSNRRINMIRVPGLSIVEVKASNRLPRAAGNMASLVTPVDFDIQAKLKPPHSSCNLLRAFVCEINGVNGGHIDSLRSANRLNTGDLRASGPRVGRLVVMRYLKAILVEPVEKS
jgi:hypothetical protein